MPNGKITAKQREILEFIKREILQRGYPPAVRDICEAVSFKINFFRSLPSGDIGEERIYQEGPDKAQGD